MKGSSTARSSSQENSFPYPVVAPSRYALQHPGEPAARSQMISARLLEQFARQVAHR